MIPSPATAKARSLLAYLALRSGEPIRRETLMSEFWPDAHPTSARNNLKTTLSSIRRLFKERGADPDTVVDVTREIVRWIAHTTVDSREFAACSLEIEAERRNAAALYGGEFLPGDVSDWACELRQALAAQFESILRTELAASPSPALAERLLALDPFSDEAYLALAEGALAAGDRRKAQAVYRRYAAALAEIGEEPPPDLAERVGLRAAPAKRDALAFVGRADEFAEIERLAASGVREVTVRGIAGIGKSAFIEEARRRCPGITFIEASADEHDAGAIELGPLAYDEVVLAVRRLDPHASYEAIDAIWKRTLGHPAVLGALLAQLERLDALSATTISRLRLPRELERHFDLLLTEAGEDVAQLAVLLALEPRLDIDDLVALLEWNASRVLDARETLARFGAAAPHLLEAALRALSTNRRAHLLEHIARRLKLHEDPTARRDAAQLLMEFGRRAEAARAYLDAARAFKAAAAFENAVRAADAGLAALEALDDTDENDDVARELHLLKGRTLYEQGSLLPAIHALEGVLDVSNVNRDGETRTAALLVEGHALVRMDLLAPAWEIAQQAREEAIQCGAQHNELAADHLIARVLRDRFEYDAAVDCATRGFDRAIRMRDRSLATLFANLVIEVSRRRLHIADAFAWAEKQLDVAMLAGPVLEAESRHMFGSVRAVVRDLDGALEEFRRALALVEMYRRRRPISATPVGQLEWMLHHALAHTHTRAGNFDQAIVESEWMLRSPWMRNSPMSGWQGVSVAVDARLAAGSPRDLGAARSVVERFPPVRTPDLRAVLDGVARARVAAACGMPDAPQRLRSAVEGLTRAAGFYPDQIHPYFFRLAESARGIDDLLGARAAELGRQYEQALIAAAGDLYCS